MTDFANERLGPVEMLEGEKMKSKWQDSWAAHGCELVSVGREKDRTLKGEQTQENTNLK